MRSFINILFSFRLAGLLLVILAISIAVASFIENDFGSETARAHIYNATWFESIFILASINLIGNMLMHRVYRKGKLSILLFHLSFLFILLGAGITRYFGFTVLIYISEGERSSFVLSDEAFLNIQTLEGDDALSTSVPLYLSEFRNTGRLLNFKTGPLPEPGPPPSGPCAGRPRRSGAGPAQRDHDFLLSACPLGSAIRGSREPALPCRSGCWWSEDPS